MERATCPGSQQEPQYGFKLSDPRKPYGKGWCPVCGKNIGLQKNGNLRQHGRMVADAVR